jgi:hypothetical protein
MPRQAAYTLASRTGSFELKKEIIQNYDGETKQVLLDQIRRAFPLKQKDKRAQNYGEIFVKSLKRISLFIANHPIELTASQKKQALEILRSLKDSL